MDDRKPPQQSLQLTARSSPLAIRLSVVAALLMGLGIGLPTVSPWGLKPTPHGSCSNCKHTWQEEYDGGIRLKELQDLL